MRSSKPPAVATWLLDHFHSGSPNDYITGDLMEAYQQGRSRTWYWKQALAAIMVSFFQEIIAHPVLALRAITIGWAILLSYDYGVARKIVFPLEQHFLPPSVWLGVTWWGMILWTVLLFADRAAMGWIVARFNRTHRAGMVLAFATSQFLFGLRTLPWVWFHVANTLSNTRLLPYLLHDLASVTLPPVAILFGGLWGAATENKPEHNEQYSLE